MVYTGPSDGCHLCRKRRIKCDGGRPQCQRCVIYKAQCPGYRTETDAKFATDQSGSGGGDAKAKAKTTPPRKRAVATSKKEALARTSSPATTSTSRSSEAPSSPDATCTPAAGPLIRRQVGTVALPQQVPNVWEDFSVCSFIHDWTIPETSSVLAIGALEFVRTLQPECQPDSDFSLALRAASLASFANQHNAPDMMGKARTNYGQALSALKKSLRDPAVATEDHVLASIVLLHIYESITADASLGVGPHDAGLRMLLEMRGDEQFDTERGRSLARFVLGYLHARNVNEKRGPSLTMMRGFQQMGYPPEHPAMANRDELRAVTALLAELTPLFHADHTDPVIRAHIISLLQQTDSLDHNFTRWMTRLPPTWQRSEYHVPRDPILDGETTIPQSGLVHVYSTPLIACYIGLYRIQYMVLHKIVLRMASRLGVEDWSIPASPGRPVKRLDRAHSLATLREHNAATLSSAPFAMGEVDGNGQRSQMSAGRAVGAFYTLWPLTHIALDINSTPDQVADALQALSYMGNILGVRKGLRNAVETLPISNFMSLPTSPTQSMPQQLAHGIVTSPIQRITSP